MQGLGDNSLSMSCLEQQIHTKEHVSRTLEWKIKHRSFNKI